MENYMINGLDLVNDIKDCINSMYYNRYPTTFKEINENGKIIAYENVIEMICERMTFI